MDSGGARGDCEILSRFVACVPKLSAERFLVSRYLRLWLLFNYLLVKLSDSSKVFDVSYDPIARVIAANTSDVMSSTQGRLCYLTCRFY